MQKSIFTVSLFCLRHLTTLQLTNSLKDYSPTSILILIYRLIVLISDSKLKAYVKVVIQPLKILKCLCEVKSLPLQKEKQSEQYPIQIDVIKVS